MALERLYAAWRQAYVSSSDAERHARDEGECVFCHLGSLTPSAGSGVIWRDEYSFVTLNAFPYGSGHLLVLPRRHVGGVSDLSDDEYDSFARTIRHAVGALERAYGADGMNIGMNLGQAAGAGIPKHLHAHALPRWSGDTNFMTAIGETRVLPEALETTWSKVLAHWVAPELQ